MTIEEIGDSLPGGFHDAHVTGIRIDYARREAVFTLEVDASADGADAREEDYRPAALRLSGLFYLAIEPPGPLFARDHPAGGGKLWIAEDSSDFGLLKSAPELPEPLPPGGFRHWFFITGHNCFIYVAATDAGFGWLG